MTKNEILPFAAAWIDLEGIILSEMDQRQILYDFKNDINNFIFKTETDSQM